MGSKSTSEIDTVALDVERLIAQNEEVLATFEEEYTPFSESLDSPTSQMMDVDAEELFA
ncbi:hypothetical protein [Halomicrobium urmianum]|uniref:hypothetical protein n=1 Tax=Halomicrobium urmianum TaxID=1586233 RepID=UPI001CD97929|nr:hypothetical protein [Halomicrobium urmianum]